MLFFQIFNTKHIQPKQRINVQNLFARLFIDVAPLEWMAFHRGKKQTSKQTQNKKGVLLVLIQQINVHNEARCTKC